MESELMTMKWNDVVALAREIQHARSTGEEIDPEKARRLARGVLALKNGPLEAPELAARHVRRAKASNH